MLLADEEAAAHHSEATARSIDDERERAANALQASVRPPPKWGLEEWEQKEAEMAREADLRRPPIASSTQLHHQRSDSAFSTAESSAISPGTGSTAATSSSRAAPAVHPDDFPAHRSELLLPCTLCRQFFQLHSSLFKLTWQTSSATNQPLTHAQLRPGQPMKAMGTSWWDCSWD